MLVFVFDMIFFANFLSPREYILKILSHIISFNI